MGVGGRERVRGTGVREWEVEKMSDIRKVNVWREDRG